MTEDPRNIKIKDYTYVLPEEKIARYPLNERDLSRLLIYSKGRISHDIFRKLGTYLSEGDILVYNRTRVIRARLIFSKPTGAIIEIFCLEPEEPADYESNFSAKKTVMWRCLVGNRKKWKTGILKMELQYGGKMVKLYAWQTDRMGKESLIRFTWDDEQLCFSQIMDIAGHVPVPPYLKREDEDIDKIRYQTVYSRDDGSVAAPTAGLHFTESVLSDLKVRGILTLPVTLHVGAGTFIPVKSDTSGGHSMHIEHFRIERETIEKISGGRIIAVGTTSLRTLESLYWIGHKIRKGKIMSEEGIIIEQWYPYDNRSETGSKEAIETILEFMDKKKLQYLEARTGIIIVPGYRMRIAEGLITNYHLPGSTLLLLVAAFTGDDWKKIYDYSLENDFRFLSYGDSSLLLP
ncbi:MAG: S-adenosylmethionine:tRNA ribosyltransferase-isomerase [Bacteroidales bacterium]|nr:S-adenosylmethionine:tRNA ribosyltransferase-isomerase [Bacteroidales bacterium]